LGLRDVPTAALRLLLVQHHRGELQTPLTVAELARLGLQEQAGELLAQLRGLDAAAVRAVLVCVLAERTDGG
jgi:hypothetical protein